MLHEESAQSCWKSDTVFKQDTKYLKMWDCLSSLAKFAVFWTRCEEFYGLFAYCVKATFPSTA